MLVNLEGDEKASGYFCAGDRGFTGFSHHHHQIHQPSNAAQRKSSIPIDAVAQQARPLIGSQLRGVQHIGITVHYGKSYKFYLRFWAAR